MTPTHEEDGKDTFSLTQKNRQRSRKKPSGEPATFTWQEQAYERLKALYKIGNVLSSTDNLNLMFPEILSIMAETFPFVTAVLLETRSGAVSTAVWHANNATEEQIEHAINNAKESFIFLTGSSQETSNELRAASNFSDQIENIHTVKKAESTYGKNYLVTLLVLDKLLPFGILQLEGSVPLDERDIEFVNALTDLISISIDRCNKKILEQNLQKFNAQQISNKLSHSEDHVQELMAERSLREKFVSLLTHDLRTPLTVIKMCADLIHRRADNVEGILKTSSQISASVHRADLMISNLLDANHLHMGEPLHLQIEQFDISHLVKKTLDELAIIHGNHFIMKGVPEAHGYWDTNGIKRVIENLCQNAVKYGHKNSPVIVLVLKREDQISIEVQNSGEVISHEDQKLLFEQFRRGNNAVNGNEKGWGIGLALVRGIVEAHRGSVRLESEVATGTIFTITLPIDARPTHLN